jgi:hypothetical protein
VPIPDQGYAGTVLYDAHVKAPTSADFSRLADAYLQMRLLQTRLAAVKRRLEGLDEAFLRHVQSVVSDARKVLDGTRRTDAEPCDTVCRELGSAARLLWTNRHRFGAPRS